MEFKLFFQPTYGVPTNVCLLVVLFEQILIEPILTLSVKSLFPDFLDRVLARDKIRSTQSSDISATDVRYRSFSDKLLARGNAFLSCCIVCCVLLCYWFSSSLLFVHFHSVILDNEFVMEDKSCVVICWLCGTTCINDNIPHVRCFLSVVS